MPRTSPHTHAWRTTLTGFTSADKSARIAPWRRHPASSKRIIFATSVIHQRHFSARVCGARACRLPRCAPSCHARSCGCRHSSPRVISTRTPLRTPRSCPEHLLAPLCSDVANSPHVVPLSLVLGINSAFARWRAAHTWARFTPAPPQLPAPPALPDAY